MKKVFLMIMLAIISFGASAQATFDPKPGEYFANNDIDKFVGTWQYSVTTNGKTTSFTIELQKIKYYFPNIGYYMDLLVGAHSNIINGIVNQSSIPLDVQNKLEYRTITGGAYLNEKNKVRLYIFDSNRNKDGEATLTMVTGKTNEANWVLKGLEGPNGNLPGFALPTSVLMKKIK